MSEIWERQDGEPTLWFSRFQQFLALGRERSLLGLYNIWRRETAEESGKPFKLALSTPSSWDKAARDWNWRKRAEDWDVAQLKAEFSNMEVRVLEHRKKRLDIYDAMLEKIGDKIADINWDKVTFAQLASAIRILSDQQRADLNDTPAQRPPQTTQPRKITRVRAVISDVVVTEYGSDSQNDL